MCAYYIGAYVSCSIHHDIVIISRGGKLNSQIYTNEEKRVRLCKNKISHVLLQQQ